jgi:pimeloyl-ACP methyl ester carboxylesterase
MVPTFSTLGSGPTVILLHGMGGGHTAFVPQVEALAGAGHREVAWDKPGCGPARRSSLTPSRDWRSGRLI